MSIVFLCPENGKEVSRRSPWSRNKSGYNNRSEKLGKTWEETVDRSFTAGGFNRGGRKQPNTTNSLTVTNLTPTGSPTTESCPGPQISF